MASFLQQLRLLLWKNWLSVWRHPVWSLALIIWPLIIFIILAITRSKFPPEKQSACYVAPRNLPSAGFFPFLQTLLCDADCSCKNKSLLPQTKMMFSERLNWSPEDANWMASFPLNGEFFDKLGIGGGRSAEQRSSLDLLTQLASMHHIWTTMTNADFQSLANVTSIINTLNQTVQVEQDGVNEMLVSADFLKKVLCNYTLPYVKKTGNSTVDFMGDSYMTFCLSNVPFLEACLYTVNQLFTRFMMENSVEVLKTSMIVLGVIKDFQNKSVVWEMLLDLPYLFLPGSLDEKVQLGIKLLENMNSILQIVQSGYPQANIPVKYVTPTIDEAIHVLQYILHWPGRGVNISLQNVLSGQPDISTSKEQALLDTVVVPLDKALLLVDFSAFNSYICVGLNGSGAPTEDSLNSLCANNGLLPVFKRIDRNKVAEQIFLVWSRGVSRSDVRFAVLSVNNLLSLFLPGSEHITSTLTTAGTVFNDWVLAITDSVLLSMNQTTREITFVDLTTAVLHTLREIPGWPYVQRALGVGVGIMEFVTDLLKTQTDILGHAEEVAISVQSMVQSLLSNNTFFDARVGKNINATLETIQEVLQSEQQVVCSNVTALWADLITQVTLVQKDWPALLCNQNQSLLVMMLQKTMDPLITKVYMLIDVINGTQAREVTAPQILSAWETLETSYLKCIEVIGRVTEILGSEYWRAWARNTRAITANWTAILQERTLEEVEQLGSELQASVLWPTVKPYFDTAYWIMAYSSQQNTTAPPNCTFINSTMSLDCSSVFSWKQFVLMTVALSEEVAKDQTSLLRMLRAGVLFAQNSFRSHVVERLLSTLPLNSTDPFLKKQFRQDYTQLLDLASALVDPLTPVNISTASVSIEDIVTLLEIMSKNNSKYYMDPLLKDVETAVKVFKLLQEGIKVLSTLESEGAANQTLFNLSSQMMTFDKLIDYIQLLLPAEKRPYVDMAVRVFEMLWDTVIVASKPGERNVKDVPSLLLDVAKLLLNSTAPLAEQLPEAVVTDLFAVLQGSMQLALSSIESGFPKDRNLTMEANWTAILQERTLEEVEQLGSELQASVLWPTVKPYFDTAYWIMAYSSQQNTTAPPNCTFINSTMSLDCSSVFSWKQFVLMTVALSEEVAKDQTSLLRMLRAGVLFAQNSFRSHVVERLLSTLPLNSTDPFLKKQFRQDYTQLLDLASALVDPLTPVNISTASVSIEDIVTLLEIMSKNNSKYYMDPLLKDVETAVKVFKLLQEGIKVLSTLESEGAANQTLFNLSSQMMTFDKLIDYIQLLLPAEKRPYVDMAVRVFEMLWDTVIVASKPGERNVKDVPSLLLDVAKLLLNSTAPLAEQLPEAVVTDLFAVLQGSMQLALSSIESGFPKDRNLTMEANWTAILQERTLEEVEQLGSELQASVLWPTVKPYFDTAYWIMAYSSQQNTTAPPNCTFINSTMSLDCSSVFSWKQFVLMTVALSEEVAKDQTSLLRMLRAGVLFAQNSFRSHVVERLLSTLPLNSTDPFLKKQFRQDYTQLLDLASALVDPLTPVNISTASVSIEDIVTLLEIMSKNNSKYYMDPLLKDVETAVKVFKLLQEGIKVLSTLESEGAANQTLFNLSSQMMTFDKLIDYIQLLLPAEKRPYVDMAVRVFEMLWDTVIVASKPGERNVKDVPSLLLDVAKLLLNSTAPLAEQLPEAVVTDLFAVLQGSMQLALSSIESGFPKDRNLTMEANWTAILQERTLEEVEQLGSELQASVLWPTVKPYFDTAYWIMAYSSQQNTTAPPNCTFINSTMSLDCSSVFSWKQFVLMTVALSEEVAKDQTSLLRMLRAGVLFAQNSFRSHVVERLLSTLPLNSTDPFLKKQFRQDYTQLLDLASALVDPLTPVNISTASVSIEDIVTLLEIMSKNNSKYYMDPLLKDVETAVKVFKLLQEGIKVLSTLESEGAANQTLFNLSSQMMTFDKLIDYIQLLLPAEKRPYVDMAVRVFEMLWDTVIVASKPGERNAEDIPSLLLDVAKLLLNSTAPLAEQLPEAVVTDLFAVLQGSMQLALSSIESGFPKDRNLTMEANWTAILQERTLEEVEQLGSELQASVLWPTVKPYFDTAYWIMAYSSQQNTTAPPNCTFINSTMSLDCSSVFSWKQFVLMTVALSEEVAKDQTSLLRMLRAGVLFAQNSFRSHVVERLLSTLPLNSTDPFLKKQFRQDYTQLLDLASALVDPLTPVNISTASVSIEDIVTLLEIMSKNNSKYYMDPLLKDVETAVKVFKLLQEGIKVLSTLESEGAANQTLFNLSSQMMTFDKLIDYIQLLLPAEKRPYVDMAVRVFEMLWDTVIVASKPGERNAEDIPSLLLDVAKLLLNSTAPLAEQLPEAVVTDLFAVLQGSMQLALSSSESGFPKDRNLTMEVIGRLQNLVRALVPQPAASILIPVSEAVKIYFETISQDDVPDTWSQIIEEDLHYFLPNDSNWNDFIILLQNISALLSQQSQGNTTSLGIAGYLLERILGSEGISGNTSLIEVLFEQVLAGWGDASHESPSPQLHTLASLFADVEHAMGLPNITEAWAERILPALIQLASGTAEKDLWKMTSGILEAVLSSLKETPAWEPVQDILTLEQALSSVVVQSVKVETDLNLYVKVLLGNLTTSLKQVIQDSGVNCTESIRPILHAVSQTANIIREDLLSGRTVSCGDISRTWTDIMHDELALNQTLVEELCNQTCFPDDLNSEAGILRQLINTTVSSLGKEDSIDGNELTKDLETLYQAALSYYESLRHFYTEISAVIINSSPSGDSSIPALIDDLATQHMVLGVSAALNPFLQQASVLPGLKQHIEAAYWIMNYAMQNNYNGQGNCDNSSMSWSCKGTDELELHSEKMVGFLLAVTKDPVLAGRLLQGTWECVSHNSTLFSAYNATAVAVMHLLKDDIELFLNVSLNLIMDAEADPSQLWKEALSCLLKDFLKNVNSSSLHQIWNGDILKVIAQGLKNAIRVLIKIKILEDGSLVYKILEQQLANSSLSQLSMGDQMQLADKLINNLASSLSAEQRSYINATLLRILETLPALSNGTNITGNIFSLTRAASDFLLEISNATSFPISDITSAGNIVGDLLQISELVTNALLARLTSNQLMGIAETFKAIEQLVTTLTPMLTSEQSHYLNATVEVIKTLVIPLYNNADALDSSVAISESLLKLLGIIPDPTMQSVNSSAFKNLGASIRRVTEVYFSNATDLVKAAGVTVTVASELQNVLKMVPPSYEVNKTLEVIKIIKDNVGSLLGINSTNWADAVLQLLANTAELVPPELPYAQQFKNMIINLATEAQEEFLVLSELSQILQTMFTTNWVADNITTALENLKIKKAQMNTVTGIVCKLEKLSSVQALYDLVPMNSGIMCQTVSPAIQAVFSLSYSTLNWKRNLTFSPNTLLDNLYNLAVGDPSNYKLNANWSSVLVGSTLNFNTSAFSFLNITNTTAAPAKVSDLILNPAAFMSEIHKQTGMPMDAIDALMQTVIPDNSLKLLAWLMGLWHCDSPGKLNLTQSEELVHRAFCKLDPLQWYNFVVIVLEHLDLLDFVYKIILTSDMQNIIEAMLQLFQFTMEMFQKLTPAIKMLVGYLQQIQRLNLIANSEFKELVAGNRATMSSKATFNTLAGAVCYRGFFSLFTVSQVPNFMDSNPSTQGGLNVDEIMKKFNIPSNATPFCLALYLDMVNTTGGAVAWAFIKPMLLGKILYTPDTPETRAIMEKSNDTLQQLDKLNMYSQDWIDASKLIFDSAQQLGKTVPVLMRSLQIPFVQNFVKLQTNINVTDILNSLQMYSNLTKMLEENQNVMDQLTVLSQLMLNLSSCVNFNRNQPVSSIAEMNAMAKELLKTNELYASIIFKMPPKSSRRKRSAGAGISLPAEMSYTIRMVVQNAMRTDRIRDPSWTPGPYISSNKNQRYNRGFINLQESIDRAIIDIQAGRKVEEPAVQLQAFPYPCYFKDNFLNSMSNTFPLALMIAWVLFIAAFVKKLVHERELRLHEYMKMMGVNPSSHFCAWFIESASFLLVTIIIMTIILKAGKIFPNSNGFIIFLFLCDYGFSILAMSFLISAFFDRTNVAGLSGSLVYIICFFPFIVMVTIESSLTFSTKSLLCLFAPTCFSYAGQYIGRYEGQNIGIQWDNSYVSPLSNDTTSFGWLCWLLFIDSLVYFAVGWYIRIVFPGKYGIASPWYFPVLPSFWAECCGFNTCRKDSGRGLLFTNIMLQSGNIDHKNKNATPWLRLLCPQYCHQVHPVPPARGSVEGEDNEVFTSEGEAELEGLPVGMSLHGLTKLYDQTVAIQNLNLNFYEGHVTTLLGHNGAGKTTTMSLLTGLYSPSSGSILVYGKDMQTHMDAVRRDMGVCMQYDVLFEHLTAKEHLLLYGQIKSPGWNKHELNQQVRNTLKETGMYAHRHKRVDTLSGGMKRKLSISIAFIGGSKTVVLDEPTTGVDPCSRRSIWDIVIRHKTGRTIILSTHHLDEAEVLSDRIAFLERGGLKCCGSPFYLKEKLGQGYDLTLTRRMPPPGSEDYCVPDTITRFIQSHLPEAQLKEKVGADLVYALPPFGAQNADAYRSLLSELDRSLDTLRLGCYGISDTTLAEVYLQMTKDDENKDTAGANTQMVVQVPSEDTMVSEDATSSYTVSDRQALTGSSTLGGARLFAQKVVGMLLKRIHHSRRDWRGLLAQIILPVLFVIAAMGMGTIKNGILEYPKINLSPALYGYDSQSVFFGLRNPSASDLVSKMMSFPGIDNFCLYNPGNEQCLNKEGSGDWTSSGKAPVSYKPCDCNTTVQVCPRDDYVPPHKKAPSLQTVYNVSQFDVENYLLSTANSFIQNRYGGWVFGSPLPVDLQMDFDPVPANRTLTKVWYNPEGYHTMPAYLNSLDNFILRANLPPGVDPQKYAISVYSQPYSVGVLQEDTVVQSLVGVLVALCILTGYSIMTASFVIYEVTEYQTGAKRLQHISGIGEIFYWIVNFIYDMTLYMVPVALSIAIIAAFQLPAFSSGQNLGAVSLLLVLFGFGTFPWMYLLAGIFKNAEMAFICYVSINLFIAINTIISTSVVYFLSELKKDNLNIKEVYNVMSYVFLIFPQFSFGNGLMELSRMQLQVDILTVFGIDSYTSPFDMDVLGWMFVALAVQGSFCFLLRLLLNTWLLRKIRILMCRMRAVMFHAPDEDPDVKAEQDRVDSGQASGDLLQLNKLCKLYQNIHKKVLAVNNISVGIPAGECFGLLGVNGAGKTTTFKMLTAEIFPSNGNALVKDTNGSTVDIMDGSMEGINIGYCPQVDALDDLLTGEEHLYYYARIRGIPSQQIHSVVMYLLQRLELLPHKDKPTCQYSCGTKRKLSTALALIGSPQILLLDEPSSGMDPRSKRHLWNIISEELKEKCAVVLTSHSMEECEALCTRLAIMVKGRFRCLGSLQHIKNRFGSGFTVKMHLTSNSLEVEHITTFMQSHFPSSFMKDHHSGMVEYHVPVAPGGVADIFDQLECNKASLSIKHFSVSQTTLDEVFINFAKESSAEEYEDNSELTSQSVNT
ncbi:uncharacterized protein abca12 isoform X2 [Polyodon spathula]|uniref:uncharacterized protein abca12 isoform X2 n=1 Tax=Polyodon spathula TaxID=7913 RepID=UPI001B7F432C|nr:uncharacterized protein abca12 isoform X2 [Polyodon spathula]